MGAQAGGEAPFVLQERGMPGLGTPPDPEAGLAPIASPPNHLWLLAPASIRLHVKWRSERGQISCRVLLEGLPLRAVEDG